MKKLGIFLFSNQNDVVEDYIQFLLDDITLNLSHLCIVMDNESDARNVFEKYSEDIFVNNGHSDIDIWKEVLVNHIGFDQLADFDEVILFDDSFFGPVYPFKEIFMNMDDVNLDLWTILSNGVDDELNSSNLQFIAFRNNLIKSGDFKEFWQNIGSESLKNKNNENYLISNFSELNYIWKNYLMEINNVKSYNEEPFFCIFDVYSFIRDYALPLINISPFVLPKKIHLDYHNGMDLSLALNYLNQKTEYDVSLIYEYLLKITDPNALVNLLNLKKIIPLENINGDYKSGKSIAVIAHLYYEELLDYDFRFLSNIPEYIDVIITTDETDKKVFIEQNFLSKIKNNSRVILVNSRGRDMSALFVGCRDIISNYDYFCFVHDKKSAHNAYRLSGVSFRDIIWENTLASEDYINSIIKSFDDNDSLGLIVPPRVYHSSNFTSFYHNYWLNNIGEIKKLFGRMNISAEVKVDELPLSIGNCYWAKVDALKPLFDLNLDYEDFYPEPMPADGTISHALERIYAYVAASQGYYSEIAMTEYYASNEVTNYPYMFSEVLGVIRNRFDKKITSFFTFNEVLNRFIHNLNDLDNIIAKKDGVIADKDKKINEVTNSNSWKVTKPLRTILKFKNEK